MLYKQVCAPNHAPFKPSTCVLALERERERETDRQTEGGRTERVCLASSPGSPVFQRVTLKNWEEPGDEARYASNRASHVCA